MLQWPGDCELSQAISCDGALVSAQTCSFGATLLATALSFKQARNVWMGLLSLQAEGPRSAPLVLHFMIQYLLVWRVHADIPLDALYSSQHGSDVLCISD